MATYRQESRNRRYVVNFNRSPHRPWALLPVLSFHDIWDPREKKKLYGFRVQNILEWQEHCMYRIDQTPLLWWCTAWNFGISILKVRFLTNFKKWFDIATLGFLPHYLIIFFYCRSLHNFGFFSWLSGDLSNNPPARGGGGIVGSFAAEQAWLRLWVSWNFMSYTAPGRMMASRPRSWMLTGKTRG